MAAFTWYGLVAEKEAEHMLTNCRLRSVALYCVMMALAFLVTGCWDRQEIENRGFVLGIAIDHVTTPDPKGQYDLPHVTQEAGQRKYRVTFELPRFRKSQAEESLAGGMGKHYIFAGEGESLYAIIRAINAKTYFSLFFEDTQIVVFSEAVAREGVGDLLDFFSRNSGIRRRIKMFVTPGRAEDILKGKLQVEEVNSVYIAKIMRNVSTTPRFASSINFGDVSKAIQEKRAFVMDEVVLENGDVKLTQAIIFNKEKKMVGELDEWEIIGGKILTNILKQGVFSIPNPANPKKLAVFEMLEPRIKVESHVKGDKLWFTLEGQFVGNLGENTEPEQDALDPTFQSAVQEAMAVEFTRQVQAAYHKLQAMKADALELGSLVHRQHPAYWKTVQDQWDDEIFPTVPLDVKIKVIIRRPGIVR